MHTCWLYTVSKSGLTVFIRCFQTVVLHCLKTDCSGSSQPSQSDCPSTLVVETWRENQLVFHVFSLTVQVVLQCLLHVEPRSSHPWVKKGDVQWLLLSYAPLWLWLNFQNTQGVSSGAAVEMYLAPVGMWEKRPHQRPLFLSNCCTSSVQWFQPEMKKWSQRLKSEEAALISSPVRQVTSTIYWVLANHDFILGFTVYFPNPSEHQAEA